MVEADDGISDKSQKREMKWVRTVGQRSECGGEAHRRHLTCFTDFFFLLAKN